jgi:hypothetical protein
MFPSAVAFRDPDRSANYSKHKCVTSVIRGYPRRRQPDVGSESRTARLNKPRITHFLSFLGEVISVASLGAIHKLTHKLNASHESVNS